MKKILFSLAVLILVGAGCNISFIKNKNVKGAETTACAQDAKICPNGLAVSRAGANCEFAPCPGIGNSGNKAADNQNNLENNTNDANLDTNPNAMPIVKITTNKGEITLELYKNDAPKTVANFIDLAKKGFYNGVIFHRVISGFMIQGGDPTGTGTGGPGYKFADELDSNTLSFKAGYLRGAVAMANSGPNTNGSQFFIMHQDYPLPNNYTIFGRVTFGMETVDAIAAVPTNSSDKPLQDVIMIKVEVVE